MNLKAMVPQVGTNAETLLLSTALHYMASGKIDLHGVDAEAMAVGLFAVVAQLEAEHPGIAERHGWCCLAAFQMAGRDLSQAASATPSAGLH